MILEGGYGPYMPKDVKKPALTASFMAVPTQGPTGLYMGEVNFKHISAPNGCFFKLLFL